MKRQTENKIILVIRETRLDDLIVKYNTISQAKFYIEHLGADFSDYVQEDKVYKASVAQAESILQRLGRVQVLQRKYVSNFVFSEQDTVIVLGQDGLVANTLKYLENQIVIGVNPDPNRWDGVLLPFIVTDLESIVTEVFSNLRTVSEITMAKVELNDGQRLYAVNDFYIGAKTHVSARYRISIQEQEEDHSSSGIIVSTGLGSTGWLKSILTGATGITKKIVNQQFEIAMEDEYSWDTQHLYFSVREPFPSKKTSTDVVFGKISVDSPMTLHSHMAGNGIIFSDGMENDFLEFNSGKIATITVAEKRGHLVI